MDIETAKQILSDNFNAKENTFTYILYERSRFPKEEFWQVYESIECLVKNKVFSREIAEQVSFCYELFLKELIFHFKPNDLSDLDDVPDNISAYIERFDYIHMAFYRGYDKLCDDCSFELERYG